MTTILPKWGDVGVTVCHLDFLPTWCPGLWTGLPPQAPETGLTAEHDTNYIVTPVRIPRG